MKILVIICFTLIGVSTQAQENMENKEVTNLVMVPDEFDGMEVLEEVLNTMKSHEGYMYMNRSDMVFSPQGPTGYKEIIEIHWKTMELMMDWSENMQNQIPEDRRKQISGIQILFYPYK
jgi:hypothetical protein